MNTDARLLTAQPAAPGRGRAGRPWGMLIASHTFLIFYCLLSVFPVLVVVLNSVKKPLSIFQAPFVPPTLSTFTLEGYQTLAQNANFGLYTFNSLTVTLGSLLLILLAGSAAALNGSGLGLFAGQIQVRAQTLQNDLDLVNTSDPTSTGALVTRFSLPAAPGDVAISGGLGFVADGTGGLQVVRYAAYTPNTVAPTLTVTQGPADIDPATPGTQVLEGASVPLGIQVSSPGQVRSVEVLLNGQSVLTSLSYPFNLSVALPTIAANGGSAAGLQVRATDTNGARRAATGAGCVAAAAGVGDHRRALGHQHQHEDAAVHVLQGVAARRGGGWGVHAARCGRRRHPAHGHRAGGRRADGAGDIRQPVGGDLRLHRPGIAGAQRRRGAAGRRRGDDGLHGAGVLDRVGTAHWRAVADAGQLDHRCGAHGGG